MKPDTVNTGRRIAGSEGECDMCSECELYLTCDCADCAVACPDCGAVWTDDDGEGA
jgi:hypothetical protein